MQDSRAETNWKQITLFLITLGVLILCALVLRPFFSAILGAIVLAVITRRPYDWLGSKIRKSIPPRHHRAHCGHPRGHRASRIFSPRNSANRHFAL